MPARTKAEVDAQSTKDRLWESLDYSYGQQRKANDKNYDQAYSQADRQMLSRGMQRSSYGAQTLANINQQRIDSNNNIWAAQIADYQNRLKDIEDTEWQRNFQERQFAENQRQFDTNLGFQRERAAASDNQWQLSFDYGKDRDAAADRQWQTQFDEGVRQYNTNLEYQRGRDAAADAQWNQQFAYQKERDTAADRQWNQQFAENQRQYNTNLAYNRERAEANDRQWQAQFDESRRQYNTNMQYQQNRDTVSDQQWNRQFSENQRQYDTNLAYQRERAAAGDNQWQQQFDYGKQRDAVSDQQWNATFNYGKERDAVSDAQWERQFAEGQRQNDRSSATSYVNSILSSGQMPSDEMLAAAGISRADAELIRSYYAQQLEAANGGSPGPSNPAPGPTNKEETVPIYRDISDASLLARLNAYYGGNVTTGKKYKTQTAEDPKSAATINRTDKKTRTISNK